jgi:hypothetical protein
MEERLFSKPSPYSLPFKREREECKERGAKPRSLKSIPLSFERRGGLRG